MESNDVIIYSVVFALSFITFYTFLKIGVKKIADTVTAKPLRFILLSLIIVGILGIGIKNLTLEPDIKVLLPKKMPALKTFDKIEQLFGGVDTVYFCVTAKNGTVWDPHILSQIRGISKKLKTSPYVDQILSITEAKSISNKDDIMEVTNIIPEDMTLIRPEDVGKIRDKVKANDMIYKRLISHDEKSALIVASVNLHALVTTSNGRKSYRLVQDKELCERIADNLITLLCSISWINSPILRTSSQ